MAEFFSFLRFFVGCSSLLFIVMLVLLALPQSRLRCVGLEIAKWALCVGLLILLPSPLDVIPDVVPGVGWLDDIGYIVAAIGSARSALGERKKRALYEEIELDELRERAKRGSES